MASGRNPQLVHCLGMGDLPTEGLAGLGQKLGRGPEALVIAGWFLSPFQWGSTFPAVPPWTGTQENMVGPVSRDQERVRLWLEVNQT